MSRESTAQLAEHERLALLAIHAVDHGDRQVLEQIAGEAESVATLLELAIAHAEHRALSWPWECAEAAPPKTRWLRLDG